MKIEVGKKYRDEVGVVITIVHRLENTDSRGFEFIGTRMINGRWHYEIYTELGASNDTYDLFEEYKEKKILAPALVRYENGQLGFSGGLYSSQSESEKNIRAEHAKITWLGNHPGYAMYEDGTPIK